jgi:hypothetical protein
LNRNLKPRRPLSAEGSGLGMRSNLTAELLTDNDFYPQLQLFRRVSATMIWDTADLDIVFLSYDEPTADANFRAVLECSPRPPKRIHGVKGFHSAYAAAADASTTERFVTIDADSVIRDREIFSMKLDDRDMADLVFAFAALNSVNGLIYGNGGIKCWPKHLLTQVPTHECASAGPAQTDFHFAYRYWRLRTVASENCFASTPYHAFRAGYREAIKLSLVKGKKLGSWDMTRQQMPHSNWSRLLVWLSVGADIPNGLWAMLGARMGLTDMWIRKFADPSQISDYDWLFELWRRCGEHCNLRVALTEQQRLLETLSIEAPVLNPSLSKWFKQASLSYPLNGLFDFSGNLGVDLDNAL